MTRPSMFGVAAVGATVLGLAACQPAKEPVRTPHATVVFDTVGTHAFVVPDGVHTIVVDAYGAEGGTGCSQSTPPSGEEGPGGLGGRAAFALSVAPGQAFQVSVGGRGGDGTFVGSGGTPTGIGGFNGGGDGGDISGGAGGGGASDLRSGGMALEHRVVVAGGGGGGGCDGNQAGGAGGGGGGVHGAAGGDGGPFGMTLPATGGGGGTATAGGAAGTSQLANPAPTAGSIGLGGNGGGDGVDNPNGGGGGGGGLYGGGGGGAGNAEAASAGGGGGSGFTLNGTGMQTGVRAGNGVVVIAY